MKQALRRAAVIAACASAMSATVPAAHAESQTHRDPRGDVTTFIIGRPAPAPGIDITRATNTYEGRTLTLRVEAADLTQADHSTQWTIRTPETTYVLEVYRSGGQDYAGFYEASGPTRRSADTHGPRGIPPLCEGSTVKRQGRQDAVVATVPRRCIGGADTVRVATQIERYTETGYEIDDARRDGFGSTDAPKLGPALDRN